jgi:hypothetical protein
MRDVMNATIQLSEIKLDREAPTVTRSVSPACIVYDTTISYQLPPNRDRTSARSVWLRSIWTQQNFKRAAP